MIVNINVIVLVISSLLLIGFYIPSTQPAHFERKIGKKGYRLCAWLRYIAAFFNFVIIANYIIYFYFPLNLSIPEHFMWERWVSILIGAIIFIHFMLIMFKGVLDAGNEAHTPQQEQHLFGGIYQKIRHPQALSEPFLLIALAFFLHSPFLVLYSLIWLPVFYLFAKFEERDLVLRFGDKYREYQKQVGMFFPKQLK